MPLYRTRLFEADPDGAPPPPFQARGWQGTYRSLEFVETKNHRIFEQARRRHHQASVLEIERLSGGEVRMRYAPEIIIEARSRVRAQQALNLIAAAKTLTDGDFTFGEPPTAVPDDERELEDLRPAEYREAIAAFWGTHGLAIATAIAAKATRRRTWVSGVAKYWISLRTCSVPAIEHDPNYGRNFTVQADPINHAIMAQAIIASFSAIEELGLEVKATQKQPSKVDGRWNPPVLENLERRLRLGRIDPDDRFPWLVRNTPTRIERRHPPPSGDRASWARYSIRDREIPVVDAIHYAGLLRSRISAHRTHALTRSLSLHDVVNVQHLARRLLLESMGFWRSLL